MYEKFNKLEKEKKEKIINAGFFCFSKNGYKKTPVDEITNRAEISKGALFYYFGSKKYFYLYLFQHSINMLLEKFDLEFDKKEQDFFKKIKKFQMIKIKLMKEYPYIFDFLVSVFFERDKEISSDLEKMNLDNYKISLGLLYENLDTEKFKDGIDFGSAFKIVSWVSEGYFKSLKQVAIENIDDITEDMDKYLNILKKSFYKEEFENEPN